MAADLSMILNAYHDGTDAANYVDALVLDEEEIENEDYRIIWTASYQGGFPPIK